MASNMRSATSWEHDRFDDQAYPPPQFSIRGTSGPYWLLISNLINGTSAEDIRLTMEPFGRIVDVRLRPPPTTNHPSSAFEIAFEKRIDATRARDQFNGALADGRVLTVVFIHAPGKPSTPGYAAGASASGAAAAPAAPKHQFTGTTESSVPYAQFSRSVSQAAQDRKSGPNGEMLPGPAPLPRELPPNIPTGPAAGSPAHHGRKELMNAPRGPPPQQQPPPRAVSGQKRKASGNGGPSNVAASAPTPAKARSLQSRLMSPAEAARAQKAEAAAKKAAARAAVGGGHGGQSLGALASAARRSGGAIPTGPKGAVLPPGLAPAGLGAKGRHVGGGEAPSLKDRIGSLPLAMRLAAADSAANKGPKSDFSRPIAPLNKKSHKKGKANGANAMDTD